VDSFRFVSFFTFPSNLVQLMALITSLGPRLVDLSFRFVPFLSRNLRPWDPGSIRFDMISWIVGHVGISRHRRVFVIACRFLHRVLFIPLKKSP
jgi:hypothetical protein